MKIITGHYSIGKGVQTIYDVADDDHPSVTIVFAEDDHGPTSWVEIQPGQAPREILVRTDGRLPMTLTPQCANGTYVRAPCPFADVKEDS